MRQNLEILLESDRYQSHIGQRILEALESTVQLVHLEPPKDGHGYKLAPSQRNRAYFLSNH
jgi:hypothetical protein